MASNREYTTAAIVRNALKGIETHMSDAEIENCINAAEGFIDAVMRIGTGGKVAAFTFSATKAPHQFVRLWTTSLSAYLVLASMSNICDTTLARIGAAADMNYQVAIDCLKMAESQPGIINFIVDQ